jgi:hypothetical protein
MEKTMSLTLQHRLFLAKFGSPVQQAKLLDDADPLVRAAVARYGSDHDRDQLLEDVDPGVREMVAIHGNATHREKLYIDSVESVREAALPLLKKIDVAEVLRSEEISIDTYFYQLFPRQLAKLEFTTPNAISLRHVHADDPGIVFFGGMEWGRVARDIATVPAEARAYFVLSVFMAVLTDQCLHNHFPASYSAWRKSTNFPKFGWTGFGSHHENPFKLLWAPEREKCVNVDVVLDLMPGFVAFFFDASNRFFAANIPDVDPMAFFESIMQDRAYVFDEGRLVQSFKGQFHAMVS